VSERHITELSAVAFGRIVQCGLSFGYFLMKLAFVNSFPLIFLDRYACVYILGRFGYIILE
jgi:hypothetical protein